MTTAADDQLVEVTVKVHCANVERIKAQAKLLEIDVTSVDAELWNSALEVTSGDRATAITMLESVSITFGWKRLIDVACSGEEGLQEVRDHLGRLAYGIYT